MTPATINAAMLRDKDRFKPNPLGDRRQAHRRRPMRRVPLPLSQMGPDFVFVEAPVNHGPAVATLVLQVDQNERRWNVRLPDGMSSENRRVQIAAVGKPILQGLHAEKHR